MENSILTQAQSLIGKNIFAEGWQYDNSGFISGLVTQVVNGRFADLEIIVYVKPAVKGSMNSFTFSTRQIKCLLKTGKLPLTNKFLNTGTNAEIK